MIHAQKPILHTYSPPLLQPPKPLPPNIFVFWHRFFYIMMISYALMYHKMTTERMMRGMVELSGEMGGIDKKTEHVNPSRQIFWGVHSVWCIVYEKVVLEWSGDGGAFDFHYIKDDGGQKIDWLSPFDVVRNRNSTCCRPPSHLGFRSLIWFTLCRLNNGANSICPVVKGGSNTLSL